jgi:hypothetical protein
MKTSEGSGLGSEKEAAHELNKTDDEASLIGHAIRSCLPFPPCVGHLRGTNPQTTARHAWQAPIVRRRKPPSVWERLSEGDAREPLQTQRCEPVLPFTLTPAFKRLTTLAGAGIPFKATKGSQ